MHINEDTDLDAPVSGIDLPRHVFLVSIVLALFVPFSARIVGVPAHGWGWFTDYASGVKSLLFLSAFNVVPALALFVADRCLLNRERERLNDRLDDFTKIQVEQAREKSFARDFGVESQCIRAPGCVAGDNGFCNWRPARAKFNVGDVELAHQCPRELGFEMKFLEWFERPHAGGRCGLLRVARGKGIERRNR